ncbi:MerC domain-containing protein [Flavobacterium sp. HTF]|uniref:MerC domain-containing protein n=1 Tax=Flavobacterium sp. HTF TaxID=2170732 RepID=UPI000D5EAAB0|nr:MerC domain-containing protein [Flavobacterium sp. HTF]PWB28480.1 MerC mercury resistance protein [Flavobacterium sp. HTF]
MKKITTSIYDILGISSASVCLVHCLIFPMLTILPLGLNHNPYIDLAFALIGLFAIVKIIKKTNSIISGILIISITLIWISILTEIFLEIHLDLMFIGGVGMVIGHFLNYKSHKK